RPSPAASREQALSPRAVTRTRRAATETRPSPTTARRWRNPPTTTTRNAPTLPPANTSPHSAFRQREMRGNNAEAFHDRRQSKIHSEGRSNDEWSPAHQQFGYGALEPRPRERNRLSKT